MRLLLTVCLGLLALAAVAAQSQLGTRTRTHRLALCPPPAALRANGCSPPTIAHAALLTHSRCASPRPVSYPTDLYLLDPSALDEVQTSPVVGTLDAGGAYTDVEFRIHGLLDASLVLW